jgi:hypothetical protein
LPAIVKRTHFGPGVPTLGPSFFKVGPAPGLDARDKKVYLTVPPPQGPKDPWNGDTRARVQAHRSNPMQGREAGELK